MCKDSNEDEWIYVVRTGSCRVIKALTQVTPKLRAKKKPQVIYDFFGTQRVSQYSIEALGARTKVTAGPTASFPHSELSSQNRWLNRPRATLSLNSCVRETFL